MQYLSLENVSKSYGEKVLFNSINLTISKGDKIALIARNGYGKSTLLKIIAGLVKAEGEQSIVHLNKNITTEFLSQNPEFSPGLTVEQAFFNLDIPEFDAIQKLKKAQKGSDEKAIQEAMLIMDELKAWDIEAKGKELLFKLNLTDLSQFVDILSGGQKKRLALAKTIMKKPDFLILDEPTNHLDIEMIEWLEKYLSAANLTLFMVTHDRYFLERVCNHIIELDKGKLFTYKGNYSQYLEKKAIRSHQESQAIDKAKKLFLKELEWIRRQPQARGTKAKSRVQDFHHLKEEISSISYEEVFDIAVDSQRLGKKILEFYDVHLSFDDKILIKDFWYKFKKGERLGICGKNGSGKTTFARLLVGLLKPNRGKRVQGDTVKFGYYTQEGLDLSEDKRVIDVIRDIAEYIPLKKGHKLSAASLLEKFMFPRPQQQVYISQLSGGEKKRLHLLTVLANNPNFLILDEPTNDLDVLTLNVLEEYLQKFQGCLVIISHDRYFMDKLVDHMFIFTGQGEIQDFNGTYSEWKKDSRNTKKQRIQNELIIPEGAMNLIPERKLSYNEKKEIEQIELQLSDLEEKKGQIESSFLDQSLSADLITDLSVELGNIKQEIERLEERWFELSELK